MTTHQLLFGTYTKQTSQGMYQATLDTTTEQLTAPAVVAELTNPTYLAVDGTTVYAVENRAGQGGIAVLDTTTQPARERDLQATDGSAPAYIGLDDARQLLFAAYYHRGTVEAYQRHADGHLTLTDTFTNTGSGPRPEQQASHIHFSGLTPDNRLVAVDLGADVVITLDVADDGKLTEVARYATEDGFGPRHIRFSPDGQYAYLLGELSSLLSVLKYDASTGHFEHVATASTIPNDWTDHNGAAAIRVSPDGRFIYTSNRGHNSIAIFEVTNQGSEIRLSALVATEGDFPRDMAFDPTSTYLVVPNQKSNNVSLFKRDAENGLLTLCQKDFPIPEGVRVAFAD